MPNHSIAVTCSKHHILIPRKISEDNALGWSGTFESALDSAFRRARYSRFLLFLFALSSLVSWALILARYSRCFLFVSSLALFFAASCWHGGVYIHGVVYISCGNICVCMYMEYACLLHCWAQSVPLLASPFFRRGLVIHRIGTGETKFWILS